MSEMREIFEEKSVILLEGVTGSGKTRIYLEWIREMKKTGKQILLMIPEIALTTQIIQRLESLFESDVIVIIAEFQKKAEWKLIIVSAPGRHLSSVPVPRCCFRSRILD